MAVEATIITAGIEIHLIADEDKDAGSVHQCGTGATSFPYVVLGADDVSSGDKFAGMIGGECELAAESALTGSVNDTVQWDDTNKVVTSSGDFVLGRLMIAKTAGQTKATVMFSLPSSVMA